MSKPEPLPLALWLPSERDRRHAVEQGRSVVANMRKVRGRQVDENLIAWAEAKGIAVRIDRKTAWGNPFEMPADGDRAEVIRKFAEVHYPRQAILHRLLPQLRARVLMCWCHPKACHGDFLCEQVNRLAPD
jgi:Domain of unknown function (DUF4326)